MSTKTPTRGKRELRWPQITLVLVATVVAALLARPLTTTPATHLLATVVWASVCLVAMLAWRRGGRR